MVAWWRIKNLRDGAEYTADNCPLAEVPCVKEASIPLGHTLVHKDILVQAGPIEIDFRTGGIWQNGKPVEQVQNPDKLILFKRKARDGRSAKLLMEVIYIGMVNFSGDGLVMRQVGKNSWKLEAFSIGVPVSE